MRRIAALVVICYGLLLVLLTGPVWLLSFWGKFVKDRSVDTLFSGDMYFWNIFCSIEYWIFIGVLALCHIVLLFLPLRIARERPIARRHIWIPIVVTGFLFTCLVYGLCSACCEYLKIDFVIQHGFRIATPGDPPFPFAFIAIMGWIWISWAVAFYLYTRRRDAQSIVRLQSQWLFRSSLLALLIAVPMHIAVRSRDECCAGYGTFVALAFGIPIMLMSLGPGVFFLYANRWKQLQPKPKGDAPNDTPMDN